MLWKVISSVLRGQILSKLFSKSVVIFMLIFIGVTSRRSSRLYFIFCAFFEIVLDIYHFQLSILIHVVCALHRHRSCVNPLGIAHGQSHSNCYFSWKRCWLVFSYHGELSCFQVSKYIKYSAYTGCISLCIYIVWSHVISNLCSMSRKYLIFPEKFPRFPDSRQNLQIPGINLFFSRNSPCQSCHPP